ncbi:MAG: hypothetical protein U9P10_04365 [Thermodesulfobacteriota bacterium]|nr:hypothetical protein [Thermodesulfobacteriota bacterium]
MVYDIVKGHQGDIRVQSEPGKGTRFTLYFPMHGKAEQVKKADVPPPAAGGDERLLVVDDETAIAKFLKISLEKLGYSVAVEENGARVSFFLEF